jgi:hypothetical protein
MAGLGRYKLTDALPRQQQPQLDESQQQFSGRGGVPGRPSKGKGKRKTAGDAASAPAGLAAEQLREARESKQAKNAEAGARDRMVEIGRGNQQAGRQRGK